MNDWLERRRRPVGWALFGLTLLLLGATLTSPGIVWDEPLYFASADRQVAWVRLFAREGPAAALDRDTVYEHWDWEHYRNPHPPIYKEAMALTRTLTGWLVGPLAGFRLAPALLFAALVALAFRWATAAWGGIAGLGAALSILLQPRLFGHAHFAATDTPLMAFWLAATAAGWWAIERRERRGWLLVGIAWGLAAGTKFTGLLAVGPLLVWGLWRDPRATVRGLAAAAGVGVVTFWVLDPMLWVDPGRFLGPWIWESLHRGDYAAIPVYYLGRAYEFSVPWHQVFVMTIAVTPVGILLLSGIGTVRGLGRRDPVVVLAAITVVLFWVLMLLPDAPHHDGVRQFIVLFPFLGMLAGYGLREVWRATGAITRVAVSAAVFLSAAVQLAWVHPYYLSYYGEAVGGVAGAHALGFETTYWLDAYNEPVIEWLNRETPRNGRVFVFGEPLTLQLQQAYGRIRPDIQFTSSSQADLVVVQMRQGMMNEALASVVERNQPVYTLELQSVPLVAIYREDPGPQSSVEEAHD